MRIQIDVTVWRGPIAESRHRIQAAVRGADGAPIAGTDDPDLVTTFRSAAKPFQLLPLVERGHADRFGWTDEQLAVMAASHTGSAYHVALVRGILDRIGLGDRRLACGYHEPSDPEALDAVRAHPEMRSALYNNCSGKHAGMLSLAVAEGWPVEGYERADHPLQRLMRDTVAEMAGLDPGELGVAIDGCSVPVFAMPVSRMARAFARLAAAASNGDARERALARIRVAMQRHARATGGAGRLSTVLMEALSGRVVAKGGAEGVECIGLPSAGLGIALKCEDGQSRGLGPATVALLEHLGHLAPGDAERLAEQRRPVIHNVVGLEVGAIEATVRSLSPLAR